MIRIQKFAKILLVVLLLIQVACIKSKTNLKRSKCNELVRLYDPYLQEIAMKRNVTYPIGDKLDSLFSTLNKNEIINDTIFRKALIVLLEKKYSFLVDHNTSKNLFYIYNVSTWGGDEKYIHFAVNVISNIKFDDNVSFQDYLNIYKDNVCIDDIVKEMSTYSLTNEELIIHKHCLSTLPTNCKIEPN